MFDTLSLMTKKKLRLAILSYQVEPLCESEAGTPRQNDTTLNLSLNSVIVDTHTRSLALKSILTFEGLIVFLLQEVKLA